MIKRKWLSTNSLAFIGAAVALLIGILIFSEVSDAIACPSGQGSTECNNAKDTAWTK